MRMKEARGRVSPGAGRKREVKFELVMDPGSEVYVVGSFNKWDSRAHKLDYRSDEGVYQAFVSVPPGRHEYKFVVDGKWRTDPNCPETTVNPFGSLNSVISV